MAVSGYLSTLKKDLGLAIVHIFCIVFHKFQCPAFFPSQDIKQSVLLSSY